jgi:hypothetical protein
VSLSLPTIIPTDLSDFICPLRAIAGLGIEIVYGFEFTAINGSFIQDVLAVGTAFKESGIPGRFWVENLPLLKYVPSWMPGAGFRRWAIKHREASRRVLNNPFREVLQAYVGFHFVMHLVVVLTDCLLGEG